MTNKLYREPLGLLTDLYQLTMAYGYWKQGRHEDEAVFHLFFRKLPFDVPCAIACGIEYVRGFLEAFRFESSDLAFLAEMCGNDGRPLFDPEFLDYLGTLELTCDIDAVVEGEAVFAHEPMVRVRGPLLQCQLLETPLLNLINFQTLIATKAAEICAAAGSDPVFEFGLRRAQGIDGGLAASRAAYIGGCTGTSNVLAGKLFDIPVKGTHAHSWVMSFDDEITAFRAYADALPNNCTFLVDTYDTVEGVRNAIAIGKELQRAGQRLAGIRLDSGDLAALSKLARALLDEGGFADAAIVASNDLDATAILQLKEQGAKIDVWGVGTKLVTAYDRPALGGVYKLAAIRAGDDAEWQMKVKLSDEPAKVSIPGIQQVVRRTDAAGRPIEDVIYCEILNARAPIDGEKLLKPMLRSGEPVAPAAGDDIHCSRERARAQFGKFPRGGAYPVRLADTLEKLREGLVARAH
ncbi:MAG: nicotinate phosphoribosyltransferase [Verrucomicrobiae bacterium]|nr:nicotinate phosphoribosyltransferase [Verrucomicrobiae bacterium]